MLSLSPLLIAQSIGSTLATKYHMQLTMWHMITRIIKKTRRRSQAADTFKISFNEFKNLLLEFGFLQILQILELKI